MLPSKISFRTSRFFRTQRSCPILYSSSKVLHTRVQFTWQALRPCRTKYRVCVDSTVFLTARSVYLLVVSMPKQHSLAEWKMVLLWRRLAGWKSLTWVAFFTLLKTNLTKLLRIEDFALRKMSLAVNNRLENGWLLIEDNEINSDTCRVKAIPFNGGHVGGLLACIRIEIIYEIMDQCFCVRSKLTRGFWSMTVLLLICVHTWIYEMSIVRTSMNAVYTIGFTMG